MSDWQPIETAPEIGIYLVSDGLLFGTAERYDYTEPETIGFDSISYFGHGDNTLRPNPNAGKVTRYWAALGGWCVWDKDTEWEDGDYEQRTPKLLQPTHWMRPMQPPPALQMSASPSSK